MAQVPKLVEHTLKLDGQIREWAQRFADKHHALFLGRGPSYPVALEGALKLKEVSYIHAEAYPAGELKHGPLALRSEEHTSELQSLMRISYAGFCLKKKK